jgi:hypothetical protein
MYFTKDYTEIFYMINKGNGMTHISVPSGSSCWVKGHRICPISAEVSTYSALSGAKKLQVGGAA